MINELISLIIGSLIGLLLGLSVVYTERKALLPSLTDSQRMLLVFGSSFLRLSILGGIFLVLLRHTRINSILVLLMIIIVFWSYMLKRGIRNKL